MNNLLESTKLNLVLLTTLEEISKEKAQEVISHPELDRKELSHLLEASLMNKFVDKNTKKPLKLSNETLIKGMHNLLLKIDNYELNRNI
jgi:hypothetical protein